jgi:hypothetical protein
MRLIKKSFEKANLPKEVIFQGGLGSQIVAYAAYSYLQKTSELVYANLDYYKNNTPNFAKPGEGVSFWKYDLDKYNINMSDLIENTNNEPVKLVDQEYEKFDLFFEAQARLDFVNLFQISDERRDYAKSLLKESNIHNSPFICIHIRRGDYLNVASHLVKDEEFIEIIDKFHKLADSIVILSDSKIDSKIKTLAEKKFKNVSLLGDSRISHVDGHNIMRNADILITSNSTYSLTAGVMNKNVVLIPKIWFGGGRESKLGDKILNLGKFSLI